MPFLEVESVYFDPELVAHRKRVLGENAPAPAPVSPAPPAEPGFFRQLFGALWGVLSALLALYFEGWALALRTPWKSGYTGLMIFVTVLIVFGADLCLRLAFNTIRLILSLF